MSVEQVRANKAGLALHYEPNGKGSSQQCTEQQDGHQNGRHNQEESKNRETKQCIYRSIQCCSNNQQEPLIGNHQMAWQTKRKNPKGTKNTDPEEDEAQILNGA